MGEPLGERRGRERGDRDDGDRFLTETLELTPDGVKLSGGRDDAGSSAEGQGGAPPADRLVGVRAESDRAIGVVEQPRKPALHPARHGKRALPLLVHVLGRVEPGALLGLEPHVGPCLMRVACQQQSVRDPEAAIMRREGVRTAVQRLRRHVGHSSVRIAQRSGKAGLFSVVSRYSAPADPPVPGFVPMVDRKSTRLNSSHSQISYAVFCLKKKKRYTDHNGRAHISTTNLIKYCIISSARQKISHTPTSTRALTTKQIEKTLTKTPMLAERL